MRAIAIGLAALGLASCSLFFNASSFPILPVGPVEPRPENQGPPRNLVVTRTTAYAGYDSDYTGLDGFFDGNWINLDFDGEYTSSTVVTWDFGGAAVPNVATGYRPADVRFSSPGTYNARVAVSNSLGSASRDFTLTVVPLVAPNITAVAVHELGDYLNPGAVHSGPLKVGTDYVFVATVNPVFGGPTGGPLSPPVAWQWNSISGGAVVSQTSLTTIFSAHTAGSHNATFNASNAAGSDTMELEYTIVP
jgi:hypothetical protein